MSCANKPKWRALGGTLGRPQDLLTIVLPTTVAHMKNYTLEDTSLIQTSTYLDFMAESAIYAVPATDKEIATRG